MLLLSRNRDRLPIAAIHHCQSLSASTHVLGGQAEVIRAARRDDWGGLSLCKDSLRKVSVAHSLFSMLLTHVGLLERHKLTAQAEERSLILLVSLFRQIVRCL